MPSGSDLYVSVDHEPYAYDAACMFVEARFDDALRADLLQLLLKEFDLRSTDLRDDLSNRKTYSAAARSLRLLMQRERGAAQKR